MLKELKEIVMIKTFFHEKVMKMMLEQNGNISKEIEGLKRNQKGILELKSTVIEMKNSLDGFKGRFEQAEERNSELEDEDNVNYQA